MCPATPRRAALSRRAALIAALASLSGFLHSPAAAQASSPGGVQAGLSSELQQAKAALDKYQDPVVAVHDGYFSTVGCVEYLEPGNEGTMQYPPGGMGIHFLNLQLVGPVLDPARPQILIYEPVGDKLRLVAAEWFVPVEAAGTSPLVIFGKKLEGPMEGHHPLMPTELHHYDLHVWLWKENPAGVFSPTNPALKCPKEGYSFAESAPRIVRHEGH